MKKYFFFGRVTAPAAEKRVTVGADWHVQGGEKEDHQKAVEIVHEISREFKKDPPQTPGEARMIMLEVTKKVR